MSVVIRRGVEYDTVEEINTANKENNEGEKMESFRSNKINSLQNKTTETVITGMNFPKPQDEKIKIGMNFPSPTPEYVAVPVNITVDCNNIDEETQDSNNQLNESMKKAVCQGRSTTEVVTQHMANMSYQVNQNTHAVDEVSSTVITGIQEIQNQLQNMNRAPRKERTAYSGGDLESKDIIAKIYFDNETFETCTFIENAKGPITVAQLTLDPEETPDFYAIWLSNFRHVITGKIDGITKGKLYKAFLDVGIRFNKQLPQTRIPDILYEMLGEHINMTENIMIVPTCGGWFQKSYLHKYNFPYGRGRSLAKLPVMKKKIYSDNLSHEDILLYQKELACIKNIDDRKIIAMYPYVSILASQLEAAGKSVNTVLNIVPYESIPLEKVCRWFAVSEHEYLIPSKGNSSNKDFLKVCTAVKDEVLIIDFRRSCQGSKHKKGNAKENQSNLIRTFAGTHSLEKPLYPCGLVTFSDAMYAGENVVNILLGRESIECLSEKSDVFTKVFGSFIRYIEMNYDFVEEIIYRRRNSKFESSGIFGITLEILNYFWANKGYSTWDILSTRINGSELKKLLNRKVFNQKELVEIFFKALREDAEKYKILSKLDKSDAEVCIRYDKEWIWIPTDIFTKVCLNHGLAGYEMQVILAYESMGLLEPDTSGKATTLQVCKNRFETYKFKNGTFDKIGLSSFLDIGKEVSTDERL